MPSPGTKPKAGPKHGRSPLTVDWTDVVDEPYVGWRPDLPETRRVEWTERDGRRSEDQRLRPETEGWWETVSTMPHCRLWSKSDWVFALATAFVADMVFCGDRGAAGELRQREKIMGVTVDARRDLRIRYVPRAEAAGDAPVVAQINSRRAHLTASA